MSIEAYLDIEETQERGEDVELAELSPEAYKGLVQQISIDKAEQSIIEEVVGVDGDDDEDEQEELREEREMKGLFEQLYEIDPETKEVFVKGSAYDLKKWDEDMVCFTFGDPERVIALESAISPGERYLSKCFNKLTAKHTALSEVVRKHSDHLRAKTISKAFAKDFQQVMGYSLPNIHMESFTTTPSSTNYNIAMEEMSNQQMALAAGAGLAGVAVVYKLVQWFARALNKNSLASNSIADNLKAYTERKETIRNMPADLNKAKANMNAALADVKKAFGDSPSPEVNKLIANLKNSASGSTNEEMFNDATLAYLNKELNGKYTPFMKAMFTGISTSEKWWTSLGRLVDDAKEAQNVILSKIESLESQYNTETIKDDRKFDILYSLIHKVEELNLEQISTNTSNSGVSSLPKTPSLEEMSSWFNARTQNMFTPFSDPQEIKVKNDLATILSQVNVEVFEKLDSNYVKEMTTVAERFKKQAEQAAKEGKEAGKENNVIKGNRAETLLRLSKEFQFVSNIVRFVISVRNQIGILSQVILKSSASSEGFLKRLFK